MQTVVKNLRKPQPVVLAKLARQAADAADRELFKQMLTDALQQLHEGNIARYRLRRAEYLAWQQKCVGRVA